MPIDKINFHVYADGTRRILVVDNCAGETLDAFNSILRSICGLTAEPKDVSALTSEQNTDKTPDIRTMPEIEMPGGVRTAEDKTVFEYPDIVLSAGEYAGMTLQEAIEADGVKAALAICMNCREIEQANIRNEVISVCKKVIRTDVATRSSKPEDAREIHDFLKLYRAALNEQDKKEAAGIQCETELWHIEDRSKLQMIYETCIKNILSRVSA